MFHFKLAAAPAILLALGIAASGQSPPPVGKAADTPTRDLAALEGKLHGDWRVEAACGGQITIRADGTYERRNYSPGRYTVTGTWQVRWDALPPTLVFTCKTSGDKDAVGKMDECKLVRLDESGFTTQYEKQEYQLAHTRIKR